MVRSLLSSLVNVIIAETPSMQPIERARSIMSTLDDPNAITVGSFLCNFHSPIRNHFRLPLEFYDDFFLQADLLRSIRSVMR